MIVTIHQPEHLPWLGFIDKASRSDLFILLDNVQYRKRYFQNRNRLRGPDGETWATVPVLSKGKHDQPIGEVLIDNEGNPRWAEKWRNALHHGYAKAPFWKDHSSFFEEMSRRTWGKLADFNEALIRYLFEAFGVTAKLVRASSLGAQGEKGALILDLCRKAKATEYLSGISGRDYLDAAAFEAAGIALRFQEFHHPIYKQLHEPFLPCMSSVDLLANLGPASRDALRGVGVETMKEVFL